MKKALTLIFLIFFLLTFLLIRPYYLFLSQTLKISPLRTLLSLDSLKSFDDHVTILILGIAGYNYEGGTLSDSMIVADFNLKTHKLLTISLPRDIWSDTLEDKINTAYAYGEAKQKNGGLKLAKAEIEAVVGIPIQYATVIDFAKFKELIDILDGVDINVERSFTDHKFPIPGRENDTCRGDTDLKCRYESITFNKGLTHMDGKTALIYVRSRHASGVEGSDFARNKRQQKALGAIKNRLATTLEKLDLAYWKKLYQSFDSLLTRDITNQQAAILLKNILTPPNFSQAEILLSQDFFLVPNQSSYNGQYALVPKDGNFTNIHQYIRSKQKGEKKN